LQQLPPELALTLELYYWEGLTYAELSYVLDIGREAVKSRLQRAKAQIKSELCGVAGEPKSMNLDDWAQSMREALSTTRAIRLDGCRTDGES
jgi:RNA polymerase sigma-70 factor (ECF subfamily)